jgi:hypothetical protein
MLYFVALKGMLRSEPEDSKLVNSRYRRKNNESYNVSNIISTGDDVCDGMYQ